MKARLNGFVCGTVVFLGVLWTGHSWFSQSEPHPSESPILVSAPQVPVPNADDFYPVRRRVAVATTFFAHMDVYLSLTHTLQTVLDVHGGSVDVYAWTPFGYGFQEIVDELHLYHGDVMSPDLLYPAMRSRKLYPEEEGAMIDTLVLGTCELDLSQTADALLEIWDARPADKKFTIVCIVHNALDTNWHRHILPFAQRSSIRLVAISDHVAETFRRIMQGLADAQVDSPGYEYVDVDVYVPVLDLPSTRFLPFVDASRRTLSQVVIQGFFDALRRNYNRVFDDLIASLEEDPQVWGYLPLSAGQTAYEPDLELDSWPFNLNIVGTGYMEIPPILANVVRVRTELPYPEYYALMQKMDIVLPAFGGSTYYQEMASSTVAMAVECNVPLLVTQRFKDAYVYANDSRVVVTRPQGLSDVAALKALRTRNWQPRPGDIPQFTEDVTRMVAQGWVRSAEDYQTFKEELWAKNAEVVRRILSDS
ncbi:hypothetical protein JAAARDRAFT_38216 [Jaapia argillacea MUCL 33604]|uniref:Glycosyltransferase family 1 protein n=1 Tax=Jaapia argillacea MUCL 33604 TaxID=933084 RepID=A0A067PTD0_9AGAM|nr:hypothetical protein JAAARDRAFT_38216 [Jaapia argillacea MUCL 33604]